MFPGYFASANVGFPSNNITSKTSRKGVEFVPSEGMVAKQARETMLQASGTTGLGKRSMWIAKW